MTLKKLKITLPSRIIGFVSFIELKEDEDLSLKKHELSAFIGGGGVK